MTIINHLNIYIMTKNEKIRKVIAKYPKLSNKEISAKVKGSSVYQVSAIRTWINKADVMHGRINTKVSKPTVKSDYKVGTYTNEGGVNKEVCRNLVVSDIINSGVTGTILSLSADNCIVEKKIVESGLPYDFVCPEMDKETYKKLKVKVSKEDLPIIPYFGRFSDKLFNVDSNRYAHIFADYCGSLETYRREIKFIFDNNLVRVGGFVAITCSVRGTLFNGNLFDSLANDDDKDKRCKTVKGVEAFFNRILGLNYGRVNIFQYNDTKEGKKTQEMLLIRIQRVE